MLAEFKKYTRYYIFLFIVSAGLSLAFRNHEIAFGVFLGVALVTILCLLLLGVLFLVFKNKADKNIWYVEELVPEDGAIFIFGEDPRPNADEIVRSLGIIYDHGIHTFDLVISGKKAPCAFRGNDFLCPFETSISNTLCISGGKFYRMSNSDPKSLNEFKAISFAFLSELNRALKEYVEQLHQPF